MNDERAEEIRKRCSKATLGPWRVLPKTEKNKGWWVVRDRNDAQLGVNPFEGQEERHFYITIPKVYKGDVEDAHFISNSREDIPYLLSRIDKLERVAEAAEKILKMLEEDLFEADIKQDLEQALDALKESKNERII